MWCSHTGDTGRVNPPSIRLYRAGIGEVTGPTMHRDPGTNVTREYSVIHSASSLFEIRRYAITVRVEDRPRAPCRGASREDVFIR